MPASFEPLAEVAVGIMTTQASFPEISEYIKLITLELSSPPYAKAVPTLISCIAARTVRSTPAVLSDAKAYCSIWSFL